ncbi:MAG: hypothetical protein ACHQ17_13490, partial [Polyangia bacterium]
TCMRSAIAPMLPTITSPGTPPATEVKVTQLLPGVDVLDVSVDQGGGVWAVTSSTVYYFPPGRATPFTYDQ